VGASQELDNRNGRKPGQDHREQCDLLYRRSHLAASMVRSFASTRRRPSESARLNASKWKLRWAGAIIR